MGATSMAGDGKASEATKPTGVSSYERSQIRLQESYKSMADAYHKMMASAERWGATLRETAEGTRQWREESEGIPADGILSQEIEVSKSLLIKTLNDQDIPEVFTIQENIDRLGVVEVASGDSEAELIDKDEAELGLIDSMNKEIGAISENVEDLVFQRNLGVFNQEHYKEATDVQIQLEPSKGNASPSTIFDYTSRALGGSMKISFDRIKIELDEFRVISTEILGSLSAHKVFDKLLNRSISISNPSIQLGSTYLVKGHQNWLFDPGGCIGRDCLIGKVKDC